MDAVCSYKNKKINLREAAELLGTGYYGAQGILAEEGVADDRSDCRRDRTKKEKGRNDNYP